MNWTEILMQIFELCVVPLLALLAKFLIDFLRAKKEEALAKTDNEFLKKYLEMLDVTVTECVEATHQTYVDSLKKQGSFDKDAQKVALKQTYENVLSILSKDAKEYLAEGCGDLDILIKNKIEAKVKETK